MSVTEFVTTARKVGSALKIRSLEHLSRGLAEMPDGEVLVTVSLPRATRSSRLNRLYWAGYVRPFSEHTGYTPMEVHEYFKQRFLSKHSKRLVIADTHGEVRDEAEIGALTTKTLSETEFKDYLREIEALALELDIQVGSNRE